MLSPALHRWLAIVPIRMRASEVDSPRVVDRMAPHVAVAVIALLLAGLVQANWLPLAATPRPLAWRPYVSAAILAATVWLMAVAVCHARLSRQAAQRRPRVLGLVSQAAGDLLVAVAGGIALWQGHAASLSRAGLWLISPTLVAAGVLSAALLLIAARRGRTKTVERHAENSRAGIAGIVVTTFHLASIAALLAALAWLETLPPWLATS